MRQHFRFENGAFLAELRPCVVGVLKRVTGKRGKRFHLANRIEPGPNQRAKLPPPAFSPQGAQHCVEDKGVKELEDEVPSMFQKSVDSIQPPDRGRSCNSIGLKRLLKIPQPAVTEALFLDDPQDRSQQVEIV